MSIEPATGGDRGTREDGAVRDSGIRAILRRAGALAALPLIALVRFYQVVISPLTPPTCRYYPSCSAYALTALQRFGPIKGTWLAVRRVLRCHPWAPGGVDHVPPRSQGPAATNGSEAPDGPLAHAEADAARPSSTDSRSPERPTPRDKGLS